MLLLDYSRGSNQESRIYNIYSHWWIFQPAIRENRRKSSPAWHGPQHSLGCATSLPFYNPKPGVFFFWRCRGGGSGVNQPSSLRVFPGCFSLGWRRSIHSAATCMVQRIGRTEWVSDDGCICWVLRLWFGLRSEEVPSTFLKFRGLETKRGRFSPWFIMACRKFGGDVQVPCFSGDVLFFWGDDGKIGRVYGLFLSLCPAEWGWDIGRWKRVIGGWGVWGVWHRIRLNSTQFKALRIS